MLVTFRLRSHYIASAILLCYVNSLLSFATKIIIIDMTFYLISVMLDHHTKYAIQCQRFFFFGGGGGMCWVCRSSNDTSRFTTQCFTNMWSRCNMTASSVANPTMICVEIFKLFLFIIVLLVLIERLLTFQGGIEV